MQRRYEAARYLADGSKEALAAAKRQLDEVGVPVGGIGKGRGAREAGNGRDGWQAAS